MNKESELLQKVVGSAGNVSGGAAAGSGIGTIIMDFFGHNASSIGAMCTAITVVAYLSFGVANIVIKKRMDEAYYRAKIKEEMGIEDE